MIVTDVKWIDKNGEAKQGFRMEELLVENLAPTPDYIAADHDLVGIVSGTGQVRNGKSTLGMQIGFFLAWLQSGGRMDLRKHESGGYINPVVKKSPNKPVRFGFENIVYTPDDLISTSEKLFKKYGKGQVIVYDETRGLDSKGTMKAVNQKLDEFLQTCGAYNHIIILILPDFFKLHEDYATTRSMFLANTYSDDNWRRGFYSFFGPSDKSWLYFNGKKKIGVNMKYYSQNPTFHGTFSPWIPFNKEEYEKRKQEKLKNRVFGNREQKNKEKMQGLLHLLKVKTSLTTADVAEELSEVVFRKITTISLENDLSNYSKFVKKHQEGGNVP